MPTLVDVAFVALFSIGMTALQLFYFFPRFRAALRAGVPTARLNAYRRVVIGQWALTVIAVLLVARMGSPWRTLGFRPLGGWRLVVGVAIVIATLSFAVLQAVAVLRANATQREEILPKLESVEFLLPRTRTEYRWFMALSVTAGVCEELLYRGYLLWALRPVFGLWGAIVVGVALFGGGHLYQGWRGVLKTGAVGAVMTAIVFGSGWIVPAMIVHALVDASAGVVGYTVLRTRDSRPAGQG